MVQGYMYSFYDLDYYLIYLYNRFYLDLRHCVPAKTACMPRRRRSGGAVPIDCSLIHIRKI
jgi:hypothetical protein